MMRKVISAFAATFVALTALAIAPSAQAATFTWSSQPLTGLKAEGATIHGGFTNFPTKSGLYIQQCAAPATTGERPTNCLDLAWVSTSGTQGSIAPTGDISFTLKAIFAGKLSTVDCLTTECGLFFRLDHLASSDKSEDLYQKITFAPATVTPTLLTADSVTVTLNGVTILKNVPGELRYRSTAKIAATAASGLPVTITPSTPDCSLQNGVITALKGSGACAFDVTTAGNDKYSATRANFPFYLKPGVQEIALTPFAIAKGGKKELALESNFGQTIVYTSNSRKCTIVKNVVTVNGPCVITARADAKAGLWDLLTKKVLVKLKK